MSKNYEEFAVKNAYYLVKDSKAIQEVIPSADMNENRWPDIILLFFLCILMVVLSSKHIQKYEKILIFHKFWINRIIFLDEYKNHILFELMKFSLKVKLI